MFLDVATTMLSCTCSLALLYKSVERLMSKSCSISYPSHPRDLGPMAQWESLFSELVSFLNLTADKERGASTALAEATVIRLEIYIRALLAIIDRIEAENGS